ncbi:cytochrome c oxidase subunit II, partial [bacterium]|nr:cytochrome c oxidase subunit II [bacterium]
MRRWLAVGLALMLAEQAFAQDVAPQRWQLNMTEGVTETSKMVFDLHMQIFWICCAIGAIVFGAMFYSMYKFRKSKGAVAAKWSHNTTAEIIWTVVPIVILVVMAVPATSVLYKMYDTSKPEMTVEIRGYQWLWEYKYHGEDVKFVSRLKRESDQARRLGSGKDPNAVANYLLDVDRPLIIPNDTKIRFVISADDVIHAWWVPVLGWKQDAIPGFVNEAWTKIPAGRTGTFRGQCAELCGKDHGFMPIVVKVVPKAEFPQALAALKMEINGV